MYLLDVKEGSQRRDPLLTLKRLGCLLGILLIYGLPVILAYNLSGWIEPLVEINILAPIKSLVIVFPTFIEQLLIGNYGILTLGIFSFVWAFPVVLFISFSIAISDELRLKEVVTTHLDPWLRKIGLNGQDLVPILSGYGCNVVAIYQTQACKACTRGACVSQISFGSACSYQIGATLSIFHVIGQPWLFIPYLLILFVVGAMHTRFWYGKQERNLSFFLKPKLRKALNWKKIMNKLKNSLNQFLLQAIPIFLLICALASILEVLGLVRWLGIQVGPVFEFLHFPAESGVIMLFSIIRKDGILLLNQGEGALLQSITSGELFVLVYLASTLSACAVTLWAIKKEMGKSYMIRLVLKQVSTAVLSASIILLSVRIFLSL
ncbi:nucleoside recognition domain-containing protein [Salipaludibacillus sp. HK11]|uniref:nucleoside recognition domain-containing protein n=1 Tax=Salipaludibacillus sp. HK11 TaxID=3394320 RepID=UPI0039FC0B47